MMLHMRVGSRKHHMGPSIKTCRLTTRSLLDKSVPPEQRAGGESDEEWLPSKKSLQDTMKTHDVTCGPPPSGHPRIFRMEFRIWEFQ